MTQEQYLKNLTVPTGPVDVVLDTDAFCEVDDQYAIGYALRCTEKLNIRGICAAPFLGSKSTSPEDGMEKSYAEILKLLRLSGREDLKELVFHGSRDYLPDENTPVVSPASQFMAELANSYSPEHPLYIVAIGAATNVASALLLNPAMKENCVIVALTGHSLDWPKGADEFNMMQDIAAARILFGCGIPLVHLPCMGVVSSFSIGRYDLEHWLGGKNPLCDYLCSYTVSDEEAIGADRPWARTIWDVTAVAWLMNDNDRFMESKLISSPVPEYDLQYAPTADRHLIRYVRHIKRTPLFQDLFARLTK